MTESYGSEGWMGPYARLDDKNVCSQSHHVSRINFHDSTWFLLEETQNPTNALAHCVLSMVTGHSWLLNSLACDKNGETKLCSRTIHVLDTVEL